MTQFRKNVVLGLLFVAGIALVASCSSTKHANIKHGNSYNYQDGFPEFLTSAFGYIDEQEGPTLTITTEIVKGSLTYKHAKDSDSLSANIAVEYQIIDKDNPENIISTERVERTIIRSKNDRNSPHKALNIELTKLVSPSDYEIVVNVKDMNSQKGLSQSTETSIPETDKENYALSAIRMFAKEKENSDWQPINSYDIQSSVDSLRFIFQVISSRSKKPLTLETSLLELKADTGLPRSMSRANYSSSSIEYKGIEYDETTELQSNRRVLSDYSSTFVEYKFKNHSRGNYRFEVSAKRGKDDEQFQARAFSVKSANFPAIKSVRELARPLNYLMDDDQYESLLEISNEDSLKQAIDRFWLKHIGNKQKTQRVIELYYTRVEEANKLFSNFKEGWKTDRGMIYILYGQPFYTRDRLKRVTWYYSYNRDDPRYRFIFKQPKHNNKYFPFDHFILNRRSDYHNRYYYQKQLWLSGQILQRQI